MADRLFKTPLRALDASGNSVAGAEMYLFATGTTTPVTAYTDAGGGTAHPTPLVSDGGGTFAEVFVNGAAGLKVDLTDSAGTSLDGYPVDPVYPESSSSTGAANVSFSPTSEIPETDVQSAIELNGVNIASISAENTGDEAFGSSTVAGILEIATVGEVRAFGDRVFLASTLLAAAAENTLTYGANISFDMDAGFNAVVNMTGNGELDNPTNINVGQTGRVRFIQDATGSRLLTLGTYYQSRDGGEIALTTSANATDILYYEAITATQIYVSLATDIKVPV